MQDKIFWITLIIFTILYFIALALSGFGTGGVDSPVIVGGIRI